MFGFKWMILFMTLFIPVPPTSQGVSAISSLGGVSGEMQLRDSTAGSQQEFSCREQVLYCTDSDRIIFDDYVKQVKPSKSLPVSDLIIATAQFFLSRPYVASTLEFEPEGLVVNLREFDCTTFVEAVLALAGTVKKYNNPSFENFCRQLRQIRYREGVINDYTDRLHYFSDWIYENQQKGIVRDVTGDAGGEPCEVHIDYMSAHPESYRQIKSNPGYVAVLREKEREISARNDYSFIPKSAIAACERAVKDGDIVCFITGIKGLDVAHLGFIYRNAGQFTFIHASSSAGKVIVNPQSVDVYAEKSEHNKGIMVVRPLDAD
jgi:hypothetical protein